MENWKQQALIDIIKIISASGETEEKKDRALAGLMRLAENAPSTQPTVQHTTPPDSNETEEIIDDDLTAEKESQMIINTPGITVTRKPRKDGRYQGRVTLGGVNIKARQHFCALLYQVCTK